MTEFGLLSKKGIIGFTDATKTIQNAEIMSRIMDYASDIDVLVMQHPEDIELSKEDVLVKEKFQQDLVCKEYQTLQKKLLLKETFLF